MPEELWDKRVPVYDVNRLRACLHRHPYPDSQLVTNGLNGLEHGTGDYRQLAEIDFPANLRVANKNTIEDPEHANRIRATFIDNVSKGRMAGPYPRPPYPNPYNPNQPYIARTSCAHKGAKWKTLAQSILDRAIIEHREVGTPLSADQIAAIESGLGLGKLRPISDSSAPCAELLCALSANKRFRGNETIMLYVTAQELIQYLLFAGPGAIIVAFDVRAAYNTLFVKRSDLNAYVQHIFTSEFGSEFFVSLTNTFGTTDAPTEWQCFANLLKWTIESEPSLAPFRRLVAHYVDNFWSFLAPRNLPPGVKPIQLGANLFAHLDSLGVPYHETSVSTEFDAIGWRFGSLPQPWVAFKAGKREQALVLLESFATATSLTTSELEHAAGFLSWLAQVFTMLKPHLTEVHRLKAIAEAATITHRVAPTAAFLLSASQATQILHAFPADAKLTLHPGMLSSATPDLATRSDASGIPAHGYGAVNITKRTLLAKQWSQDQLERARADSALGELSSTCLEAFALLGALQAFIEPNQLIEAEVDSDALASALARGSSSSREINIVISDIIVLVSKHNCALRVRQIPRDYNQVADCLSHLINSHADLVRLDSLLTQEFGDQAAKDFIHNSDLQVTSE
jgi:hypothetical protein